MESLTVLHLVSGHLNAQDNEIFFKLVREDDVNTHIVVLLNAQNTLSFGSKDIEILSYKNIGKFLELIKTIEPHVLQAWGLKACVIFSLAKALGFFKRPLFWFLQKPSSRKIDLKLARLLSFLPKKILFASDAVARFYWQKGFSPKKSLIVPEGIDLSLFIRNDDFRQSWRETWLIDDKTKIIGMVGDYVPEKDHDTLLKACQILQSKNISFKLILMGKNVSDENFELVRKIHDAGLKDYVLCLGERKDAHLILPVFDFAVLSSSAGEAFPLFLCEAMACGVPCIATHVGACKKIVGDYGIVVPSKDPDFLARGIEKMFSLDAKMLEKLKEGCRDYIMADFSLSSSNKKMLDLYRKTLTMN